MNTPALHKTDTALETIQLIKGSFTPDEAADIMNAMIDKKINFHKVQRMQTWVGDSKKDLSHLNDRIIELEKEKLRAKEMIHQLRSQGKNLKINGVIEISAID